MRVKRGVTSHSKHKKLRAQTKGYSLVRRSSVKQARQAILKALQYQYRDRRNKKRDLRAIWITRINAAVSPFGISYSAFMGSLQESWHHVGSQDPSRTGSEPAKVFKAVVETTKAAK